MPVYNPDGASGEYHRRRMMLHGYRLWTMDPWVTSGTQALTAGVVNAIGTVITEEFEATRFTAHAASAANAPLANVYGGVYSRTGVLLGKTADMAAAFIAGGTGATTADIVAEPGQSLVLSPEEQYYFLAFLVGTQGATALSLYRGASGNSSVGSSDPEGSGVGRVNIPAASGASALPATFDPDTAGGTTTVLPIFIGLS